MHVQVAHIFQCSYRSSARILVDNGCSSPELCKTILYCLACPIVSIPPDVNVTSKNPLCYSSGIFVHKNQSFWIFILEFFEFHVRRCLLCQFVGLLVSLYCDISLDPAELSFPVCFPHFCQFHSNLFREIYVDVPFFKESSVIRLSVSMVAFLSSICSFSVYPCALTIASGSA